MIKKYPRTGFYDKLLLSSAMYVPKERFMYMI